MRKIINIVRESEKNMMYDFLSNASLKDSCLFWILKSLNNHCNKQYNDININLFHTVTFNMFAFTVLLCRGKAVKDFSGPDCRFLSFKESETIYVYYKLSGRRADMWAGSVSLLDLLLNHLWKCKCFA